MSSDDSDRRFQWGIATVAVFAVCIAAPGVVFSLATANGLLTGSVWALPALVCVAVVAVTLVAVVVSGGPSQQWRRTPYW
jgi:ABC-type enterochelin transport system permease subunit